MKKMRKLILASIVASLLMSLMTLQSNAQNLTLHDFKVESIDGQEFDLSQFKGKKVMVVNVASMCGLTPQYENLQKLYERYKNDDFVIVAFPAGNFNNQEYGSNEEIKEFCSAKFNITFPIMSKISVKGDDVAPVYSWLTSKEKNGVLDTEVSWNFQKFLIDEEGKLVKTIEPRRDPMDKEIIDWIEEEDSSDKLVVVWSSGDPMVAERLVLMYTHNAKLQGWFKDVTLIVWGPSAKLIAENEKYQESVAKMMKNGVVVQACIACSNLYGVTEKLKDLGYDVRGMGLPLSNYIKNGDNVVTF